MKNQYYPLTVSVNQALDAMFKTTHSKPACRQVVVYEAPHRIVKVTRQHKPTRTDTSETLIITIGKPAYRQRQFIKACIKAGEPFPVKKPQLKWFKK